MSRLAVSHQPCRRYYSPVAIALTREVSPALAVCELTHLERCFIDVDLAREQHLAYEQMLRDASYAVERLPATREMPDSVFIEDIAVVVDEVAIITRPGAESRRVETPVVADALARYRTVRAIEPPGTMDGGDVLIVGRRVFVGRSTRTNAAAIDQMRALLAPFGYVVCDVEVRGCLHLKSAVTALADDLLLANPAWLDKRAFAGFEFVDTDPGEAMAANALRLRDRIVYPTAFPRTADRLASRGLRLALVDASEVAKAEGAVTCCSLIFDEDSQNG
jgi:dimethylargininase